VEYIDRTFMVRKALLVQPILTAKIRAIFDSLMNDDDSVSAFAGGNSREVYDVGDLEIGESSLLNIILKLYKKERMHRMDYHSAIRRGHYSEWTEFGTYEMFFDFIVGNIENVRFRTESGLKRYKSNCTWHRNVKREFSLDDNWGGTVVSKGDHGAVPYFQMVVRYKNLFGILTEGLPSIIKPRHTAHEGGDDYTVEGGRIIDLGTGQCALHHMDMGGYSIPRKTRHPNILGVYGRGEKYFKPSVRLDL